MTNEKKAKYLDDLLERLNNALNAHNAANKDIHSKPYTLQSFIYNQLDEENPYFLSDWFEKSGIALEL